MIPQPDQAANVRATGARLEERAERVSTVIRRIDTTLEQMTFTGPAADQLRQRLGVHRAVLAQARTSLLNGAEILRGSAARLAAGGGTTDPGQWSR